MRSPRDIIGHSRKYFWSEEKNKLVIMEKEESEFIGRLIDDTLAKCNE